MYVLTVTHGPDRGTKLSMKPGETYSVGCNDDASLTLTDPMVLKHHCSIECEADTVILRNHTASAGTYVGDKKISQARVRPGVTFRVGDSHLKLTARIAAQTLKPALQGRARRHSQDDPLIGKIIGGYKLNEVIGMGGMGSVYRATQLSLNRDVAVKVLRNRLAKDKSYRDMFIHEARAAAELIHPNVVQVYDAGSEGEISFFSMEYIGQGSVEEILARDGQIPWQDAILMALEAAHGLEYAEGRGIVHRDIKPDNLMLNDDGRIKIADLGLAKKGEGRTDQGIIGTPHFIPPEQALGKSADSRADIYSLGATFFRMITGRTLFAGQTAKEIVLKHIREPAPAASSINKEIPGDLDAVMARMLAKDPDSRFANTKELIHALEEVCAHHGIKGSIIKRGVGKRVLIPLVLLILAGSGAIWWLVSRGPERVVDTKSQEELAAEREKAKQQREKIRQAEIREKKGSLERELLALNNRRLETNMRTPLDSVYDDERQQAAREKEWRDVEAAYRTFAEGDAAIFEELGLAKQALTKADDIKRRLERLKKGAAHKKKTIAAYVEMLKKRVDAQNKQLADFRANRQYNAAAALCTVSGATNPTRNDPLGNPEKWVYKSEDGSVKTPATAIKEIREVAMDARKRFREERKEVLTAAQSYWGQVKAQIDKVAAGAPDADYQKAIDLLQEVEDKVPAPRETALVPELKSIVSTARQRRRSLQSELTLRRETRISEDRMLCRTRQRKLASLDPDINPNLVMQCDFEDAEKRWLQAKEDLQTERYRRFAEERIEMLRWCHWLFARFEKDSRKPDLFRSMEVEYPLASGKTKKTKLARPDDKLDTFSLAYRTRGSKGHYRYAQYSMDWIHDVLFFYRAEPRWKETVPAIRFGLAAFCFETMQYERAKEHFDKLVDDPRYGATAKALSARAEREADAKRIWLQICNAVEKTQTTQQVKALRQRALQFGKQFEGTLFYLEVMAENTKITRDFFEPAATPKIEKAPPVR